MKKNLTKRVVAGIMAGTMLLGLAGCGAEEKKPDAATVAQPAETPTEEEIKLGDLIDASFNLDGIMEGEKDETVYAMADVNGNVNSVIVSEWLKNSDGAEEIKDRSILTDIENVKGDETFTQNGEEITWQANGKPIYYQGKTTQELPVGVKVSYKLNGEDADPSTLAGVSGKVTVRFDYTNNAKVGEVYAPFLMGTGVLLDGDKFSNVKVTNGKVIGDGSRFIVIGVGMPGMNDSLNMDIEGINFPNDECRFLIMMKVPYASLGDKLVQRKMNIIPGYYQNDVCQKITQGIGRIQRSKNDWGITYIMDGCFNDILKNNKNDLPTQLLDRIITV